MKWHAGVATKEAVAMSFRPLYTHAITWGWPAWTHTHSFIHNAFERAYAGLGVSTRWLDNTPASAAQAFPPRSLFITEGQVDSHMPLRPDLFYVVHNCNVAPLLAAGVPRHHILAIQVLTNRVLDEVPARVLDKHYLRFNGDTLFMPWGTDLLTHECQAVMDNYDAIVATPRTAGTHFTGMIIDDPWGRAERALRRRGHKFSVVGGYSKNNVGIEESMERVQRSVVPLAVQNAEQIGRGYIPCRIFKNISYGGGVGITNNPAVQALLGPDAVILGSSVEDAVDKGLAYVKERDKARDLRAMALVRDEHTYYHRIWAIDECFWRMAMAAHAPSEAALAASAAAEQRVVVYAADNATRLAPSPWQAESVLYTHGKPPAQAPAQAAESYAIDAVGGAAHALLVYIVDHYDALPARVIFASLDDVEDVQPLLEHPLAAASAANALFDGSAEGASRWQAWKAAGVRANGVRVADSGHTLGSFWARYVGEGRAADDLPNPLPFYAGAFSVSRAAIRRHPRSRYVALLESGVARCPDSEAALFVERLWWAIFGGIET